MRWSRAAALPILAAALSGAAAQDVGHALSAPIVVMPGDTMMRLMRRSDVQNHLRLTLKQRQALADMAGDPARSSTRVAVRAEGPKTDPEALRRQVEDQLAAMQAEREKGLAAILKPGQMVRLRQLDLQWRGSVALGDPKVAEALGIATEQRPAIARIAADYMAERQKVMLSLAQQETTTSPDGAQVAHRVKLDTSALDDPLSPARKRLDMLRDEACQRIVGLLTDDERARWARAQGAAFTFRKDLPGSWR